MTITITARGEYPMPMPEPLREALAAEVEKHMQGYGLKDIRVEVGQADALVAAVTPTAAELAAAQESHVQM